MLWIVLLSVSEEIENYIFMFRGGSLPIIDAE